MKQTVVPAQITTVEDRIAGNLTLAQVLLLLVPLFAAAFAYIVLPAPMQLTLYKIPLALAFFLLFSSLSLRVKGKIGLAWLVILARYSLRPRFWVFDKNEAYTRKESDAAALAR